MNFFKKQVNIEYEPVFKIKEFNPFIAIKSLVPDWYKKIPLLMNGSSKNVIPLKHTVKACTPFLDATTFGYSLVTISDIAVEQRLKGPYLSWTEPADTSLKVVTTRDPGAISKELIPNGFSEIEFVWLTNVAIKVPKGYGMLFTHPLNREDFPFRTLSAFIDGGFPMQPGKIPFFIRNNFEGIIPKGTPFVQILPFKVDKWNSRLSTTLLEESVKNEKVNHLYAQPRYKSFFWNKKQFN
jgi:hypothetical protein